MEYPKHLKTFEQFIEELDSSETERIEEGAEENQEENEEDSTTE